MHALKRNICSLLAEKGAGADWIEAAQKAGLWFNEPIVLKYEEYLNKSTWVCTNERILEVPFVLQALARIEGAEHFSILDVGSTESLLAYQLASLNYHVTAVDIRSAALQHPNLKFVQGDILKLPFESVSFDCAIALSTIEHIGLGWYGDEVGLDFDVRAVERIYQLIRPGGYFLITVPFGIRAQTPLHRIYDRPALDILLGEFKVVRRQFGIRLDEFSWSTTLDENEAARKDHHIVDGFPGAVAMFLCKKA